MRILLVSSFLPFPLFSGGSVRLYNLLKQLHKKHAITLVCEKRPHQTEGDIEAVKQFCDAVYVVERKKQWSITNILTSGFSSYPFLMVGHTQQTMKDILERLLAKETFDLIHVETFYVMQNLPQTTVPVVLVEHNIEYLVYERYAQQLPRMLRPLFALDIQKIKTWEERFWTTATKLVAVSQIEKDSMNRDDVAIVPNGVDIDQFKMQNAKVKMQRDKKRILYIGDFKWIENQDACRYILTTVWPKIYEQTKGSVALWIVGKHIPPALKAKQYVGQVIFDEQANDTVATFSQADVLLAPIRVGGGTSFKILEAMASGVPVVTTKLGIAGLTAKEGEHVLVGETSDTQAALVARVLEDDAFCASLVKKARALVEKTYNWKHIATLLDDVYRSTI